MTLRIALIGAVEASRVALDHLHRPGVELLVLSLEPSRSRRHSDYCDLAPISALMDVPSIPISNVNDPAVHAELRRFGPDIVAVFGWSQIVKEELRSIPRIGVLGWHPSALPRNRGRAVIPWTILQRATDTGFTIFWIDEGVDSGDIAAQVPVTVAPDETATTLYEKMMTAARMALSDLLPRLLAGEIPRCPQDHAQATYCAKRDVEDGRIDWTRSQDEIWTLIRASTRPYPGAFCDLPDGRLIIWSAEKSPARGSSGQPGQIQAVTSDGALVHCGDGANLLVTVVEREPGKPQRAADVLKVHEHLSRAERYVNHPTTTIADQ